MVQAKADNATLRKRDAYLSRHTLLSVTQSPVYHYLRREYNSNISMKRINLPSD